MRSSRRVEIKMWMLPILNRTPIVGLRKFGFDDRRCGSFVCVRIEGDITTTRSGVRRWGSSESASGTDHSPVDLPCRSRPRENGFRCTDPVARSRSWEATAANGTTGRGRSRPRATTSTTGWTWRGPCPSTGSRASRRCSGGAASTGREARRRCGRSPGAGRKARGPNPSPNRRASGNSPNGSRSSGRRSRIWEKSGSCGRRSHEIRAKRRRSTARRAGAPARPPAEDQRSGEVHVLLSSGPSRACDAPGPRTVGV